MRHARWSAQSPTVVGTLPSAPQYWRATATECIRRFACRVSLLGTRAGALRNDLWVEAATPEAGDPI